MTLRIGLLVLVALGGCGFITDTKEACRAACGKDRIIYKPMGTVGTDLTTRSPASRGKHGLRAHVSITHGA